MRKLHAACVSVMVLSGVAMAQPAVTGSMSGMTTGTAGMTTETVASATPSVGAAATTGTDTATTGTDSASTMTAARRQFTQEMFEQRWKNEEAMYREAGIADEKIQRLRDLNSRMWEARSSGQRSDFQTIMRERAEILTPEETEKIREVRRAQIEKQLGRPMGQSEVSTSPQVIQRQPGMQQNQDNGTTASAGVN